MSVWQCCLNKWSSPFTVLSKSSKCGSKRKTFIAGPKSGAFSRIIRPTITDDYLSRLGKITQLSDLRLSGIFASDTNVSYLKRLRKLRRLELIGSAHTRHDRTNIKTYSAKSFETIVILGIMLVVASAHYCELIIRA